jgi:GDP-L-fucose synthase
MPTNLYGPHDNYDLKNSHVLPALLRKFHEAKAAGVPEVEVWGTGTPRREFLHVDDLADACYWLLENYNEPGLVNVGTGTDLSIKELAELVQRTVGYEGSIRFNTDYPDGTPRKLMDVSKLASHGWVATIGLEEGVAAVYADSFDSSAQLA